MTIYNKVYPVPEMCGGCAWNKKLKCEVITEPRYIYNKRGTCFAKATAAQVVQIESEIALRGKPEILK